MDGRIVETRVTVEDPEWLPEDTEAALEYEEYRASLCSGCGQPRHESFDKANFEAYEAEPLQCHACAAKDRTARVCASNEHFNSDGIYFTVTRDD